MRRDAERWRGIERQVDGVLSPDEGLEAREMQGTGAIHMGLAWIADDEVPHPRRGGEAEAGGQHEVGAAPRDADGRRIRRSRGRAMT